MSLDVIAFGAHPDDVELSCGGTLAAMVDRGYRVGVVALTAGELGTRGDPDTRRGEFGRACAILGVAEHSILGLPDGHLAADSGQKRAVVEVIRRGSPRIVLAPYWVDRHPDHARASQLVSEAAYLAGLARYAPEWPASRPHRVCYYPSRQDFAPSFIVDVTATHERKLEAIRAYRSQFHVPGREGFGEVETNISRPGFLGAIEARARLYGAYIGVDFGEAYLVREPLRLDDPVAFFGPGYLASFL